MRSDDPQPGEVWIVTTPTTDPDSVQMYLDKMHAWVPLTPFIIRYLSVGKAGIMYAGPDPEGVNAVIPRVGPWHEHFTRIWPPVPSWKDLGAEGLDNATARLRGDDLRAQHNAAS